MLDISLSYFLHKSFVLLMRFSYVPQSAVLIAGSRLFEAASITIHSNHTEKSCCISSLISGYFRTTIEWETLVHC